MTYKPKNVASFRDDSSDYPKGGQGRGPATVPGTTGSNDRGSQPVKADAMYPDTAYGTDANMQPGGKDFSIFSRGNDDLDAKRNPDFGKRTYAAGTPTL